MKFYIVFVSCCYWFLIFVTGQNLQECVLDSASVSQLQGSWHPLSEIDFARASLKRFRKRGKHCPKTLTFVPNSRFCHHFATEPDALVFNPFIDNVECRLAPFDANKFWSHLKNDSFVLIGDSLIGQLFQNMQCDLEFNSGDVDRRVEIGRERVINSKTGGSLLHAWAPMIFQCLHCDLKKHSVETKASILWGRMSDSYHGVAKNKNSILVFEFGSWFSVFRLSQLKILENARATSFEKEVASIALFRTAVEFFFNTTLPQIAAQRVVMLAVPPGHVNCHQQARFGSAPARHHIYGWHLHQRFNEILRQHCRAFQVQFLDIFSLSNTRQDGHPAQHVDQSSDCLHWCNPGPTSIINSWSDSLFNLIF